MRLDPGHLSVCEIRRRFDRVADRFDEADYVHRATFDGLLDRLQPVTVDARLVIDLGCATGTGSAALAKIYRKARVVGMDVSGRMLDKGAGGRSFVSRVRQVQCDACNLPLRDQSADIILANMLLPWINDFDRLFGEVNRALRKDGIFAFASLGPGSLSELGAHERTSPFPDMHDIGDALIRAGLREPVLDVDRLRITWQSVEALQSDMLHCGATEDAGLYPAGGDAAAAGNPAVDLELVFGHAWGSGARREPGEFRVEPGAIGFRGRDKQ